VRDGRDERERHDAEQLEVGGVRLEAVGKVKVEVKVEQEAR
jgi:hypothetical protein